MKKQVCVSIMICFILLTENNFIGNINNYTIQSNDIILQFYNFIRKIRQSSDL